MLSGNYHASVAGVVGVTGQAPQYETRQGDGKRRDFTMGFPLAQAPVITVNGQEQTVGVKGVDASKQWYYAVDDVVIAQDHDAAPLNAADTLVVAYTGLFPLINTTTSLPDEHAVHVHLHLDGKQIAEAILPIVRVMMRRQIDL